MSLEYALSNGYPAYQGVADPVVICDAEAGVTRQSMKDECDINIIMARYLKTGVISHVTRDNPIFADVSDVPDYRESVERVKRADEVFNRLPADQRARFNNDTALFIEAVSDPSRTDQLIEWGVLAKPERPAGRPLKLPAVEGERSEDGSA